MLNQKIKAMNINNLNIEVTRRCNMQCEHCLRGDAENMNIDYKYIDSLLSQCDYISSVTFTGGEPSLNVGAITYFLNRVKELNISIGSFYIATNGLNINEQFVIECLKLYAYSDEKELCSVNVSNDLYHANQDNYNTELLDGLSFFSRRNKEECDDYDNGRNLISEGRAQENFSNCRTNSVCPVETVNDFNDANIYLNCNGDIINGCDWSYKNQNNYILCSVNKLEEFFNSLPE